MAEMQTGDALKGAPGELRFTIEVKRAATGKVETYEMTGTPVVEDDEAQKDDE